ncbi:MAG: NADP-dependent malic enzyme [Candidatus Freyarchaeota archaeon]
MGNQKVSDRDAVEMHAYFQGKIETIPKCWISGLDDFAIWYTPGVAEACKAIIEEKDKIFELTLKWNTIAVVSDGTRVLGLGNIGPEAALPVMEGKSLLFKYLGGVDAVPLCLNTTDEAKIVEIVKAVEPSFGGINLEDIEKPKCFSLLERLKNELSIPVWHDDQQGTSLVVLAALINALKIVGKKLEEARIMIIGSGAAGMATARLLMEAGVGGRNMLIVDSKGILSSSRPDIEKLSTTNPWKAELARRTNPGNIEGGAEDAVKGSDVLIALSVPKPGTVKK